MKPQQLQQISGLPHAAESSSHYQQLIPPYLGQQNQKSVKFDEESVQCSFLVMIGVRSDRVENLRVYGCNQPGKSQIRWFCFDFR
ncbi:unnamed protein product [Linum tenue]|uniref:Uncharacterized protein n=1 Tax=Linum tenue TaxID=586396 RepID=A0AAV0LPW2_9ROSI|nr:unnamed protein product [Linum tenue]